MNHYDLSGRTALVTGATQGIGLATASLLAKSGARVVIHGLHQSECKQASQSIADSVPLAWDLADVSGCDKFCADIEAAVNGRLDILVHNVGIYPQSTIEKQTVEAWQRVQRVNVEASYQLTQRLLPSLKKSDSASIIFISSIVLRIAYGDSPAYTASKAAQIGLARHLAGELGPHGIRCNCVLPGLVDTPGGRVVQTSADYMRLAKEKQMMPLCIQPQDIAHAVVFLASPAARAITAACLDVNGGWAVGG